MQNRLNSSTAARRSTVATEDGAGSRISLTARRHSSSWGRYPNYNATVVPIAWQSDFPAVVAKHNGMPGGALAVGMGRSYGDSCLLKDGNLLLATGMNRLLAFEEDSQVC